MSASIDQLSSILLTPLPTRFRHSNIIPRSASESNRAALLFNSHVRMAGVKIMPCYLGIQPPSRFHSRQNGPHARLNLLHRGNSLSVSRPQRDRIHLTHLTSSSHNYPSCQFLTFGAISSQGQGFLIAGTLNNTNLHAERGKEILAWSQRTGTRYNAFESTSASSFHLFCDDAGLAVRCFCIYFELNFVV